MIEGLKMAHRHHYAEKLGTWKDGTKIRIRECKCGVILMYSLVPKQSCKSCGKIFDVNEMIFLTKEFDYFRCKTCLADIVGQAFKELLEKE